MPTNPVLRAVAVLSLFAALAACRGGGGGGNDGDDGPTAPRSITLLQDTVTPLVNDLRGLTYASDGRIYASGHSSATADARSVIVRYNADGSLDSSFGGGDGVLDFNVAENGAEESFGIVELANGDVVVAVSAADGNGGQTLTAADDPGFTATRAGGTSVHLLRFDRSGAPVTSFGNNGRAEIVLGWADADNGQWPVPTFNRPAANATVSFSHAGFPTDTAQDLKVDRSGGGERIVLFAIASAPRAASGAQRVDNDRYVARILAATGAHDPSFNGGRPFAFNTPPAFADNARRGTVETDGSILSAGYTNLGSGRGNHVVLLRLTPSGTLDPNFGNFITPTIENDPAQGAIQPGVAIFNPYVVDGGNIEAYAAGRQSSGAYVTTGYGRTTDVGRPSTLGFQTNVAQDLMSGRVANRALDLAYGNNGNQAIQSESQGRVSSEDRGRDLVVLADDRSVHVGLFGGVPAVFVLTPSGQLDTSVGTGGILELPNPTVSAQFFNAELSADGRRIAATTTTNSNGARLVLIGER